MSNITISQLPVATTPLGGSEVLPIVQSGTTKQVSVANLTAGRAINATTVTATTVSAATVSSTVVDVAGSVTTSNPALTVTGNTASGSGIALAPMMVRVNASRTKITNDTNLESVFNTANRALTLAANTLYYFRGAYRITTSATTSSAVPQIGFIFSNAQQTISYKYSSFVVLGYPSTTSPVLSNYASVATAQSLSTTGLTSATAYYVEFEGWFKSNATTGGTVIPAFTQTAVGTSVPPTVGSDSWIMVQPMSSNINAQIISGTWGS